MGTQSGIYDSGGMGWGCKSAGGAHDPIPGNTYATHIAHACQLRHLPPVYIHLPDMHAARAAGGADGVLALATAEDTDATRERVARAGD